MSSPPRLVSQIEPLEARIAPAVVITNPLPDLSVGPGKTGATIDLSQLTAPVAAGAFHTKVKFTTNVDMDPIMDGLQAGEIVIELYDDTAPRTVQNFVRYVTNLDTDADYDGTIIHRSAALDGVGAPDIIQGGGYAFPGFAHIQMGPEVFNEYNSARENVRGTIALAKTGLGPSTGTSEWFFNVVDNSAALNGTNNGGFAVFGKVVSGLDVVDKIAGLTTQNFGGVFSTLPVQGAVSGTPTADQVVRIVDAEVLPITPVHSAGLTYSISHIFKVGANGLATATTSDAVKGSVTGATLNLNYVPGKSGVADVVVKVTDGTGTTEETFRVDLRPNLFLIDTDTQLIIPGNAAPLKFKVINDGASSISGLVKLELSFKRADVAGSPSIPLGVQTAMLTLAAGASKILTVKTPIPASLATSPNETYEVTAKIVPLAAERDATDNNASGGSHQLVNQFGNFAGRGNVVLKYNLGGGTVNWTLTGPGLGGLTPDATGKFTLETTGTTLASIVTAVSSKTTARTPVTGIQFNSAIGAANLGSVDVSGLIAISGGIKMLTLGDLSGESLMLIGPVLPDNGTRAVITLRNVTNFSVESGMPLAALTVAGWKDTGSVKDAITAPSLGSLRSAADFEANLTLTDGVPTTSINVLGKLQNSTITTTAGIGSVTLGAMLNSNLFVGVASRPAGVSDFANPFAIQSFTIVGGIKDYTGVLFSDSQVAAQTLGTIKVQRVEATPGHGDFGFIADVIRSYSRRGGPAKINVLSPQTFDDLGDYVVTVL